MKLFTSESVLQGHPDKLCDIVSDTVLDLVLSKMPAARVAVETMAKTGFVHLAGEVTCDKPFLDEVEPAVRNAIVDIGYDDDETGFNGRTCAVHLSIGAQSPDIAQGVDTGGAGDQGMMFGYACDETPELMPAPIMWANSLAMELAWARDSADFPDLLLPDGKCQITVVYDDSGKPYSVDTVVASLQHRDWVEQETIRDVVNYAVQKVPGLRDYVTASTRFLVNPTGRFVIGGPMGDTGVTGRKIIVDTYGGMGRHGGGAFSGKDPSKVDRSAAYAARWVAKNVVAARLARRCEVQLSYAIGVAAPVSVRVDTFGTNVIPESNIERAIQHTFDLTPRGIITELDLRNPIYADTACYGHFGWDRYSWEETTKSHQLARSV